MIYKCDDDYLAAILLTFKDFTYEGKEGSNYLIQYKSKKKLLEVLERYINNSLNVDLEKLKEKQMFINNL